MTVTDLPTRTDWRELARSLADDFASTAAERERAGTPPVEELDAIRSTVLPNLLIPTEYGGEGGTYSDAAVVISELAAADPNIGALFAYHVTNYIPSLLDYDGDNAEIQRRSAEHRWIWGNVTQPWVPFSAEPTADGGFVLNGVKPFNTGVTTGDVSTVLVPRNDRRDFVYLAIPVDREGQRSHNDWDGFGLRRSDTVTLTFENVVVRPDEVYVDSHDGPRDTFPPYYAGPGALAFASIQVGAAVGALRHAVRLAENHAASAGTTLGDDPDATAVIGRLWARVRSAEDFRDSVAEQLSDGFARRREIERYEIVDHLQRAEALRLYAAGVALEVASEVYEIPGVTERAELVGLDRYWRDARIHSLHVNPRIYHQRLLGDFVLNGSDEVGPPFFLD